MHNLIKRCTVKGKPPSNDYELPVMGMNNYKSLLYGKIFC